MEHREQERSKTERDGGKVLAIGARGAGLVLAALAVIAIGLWWRARPASRGVDADAGGAAGSGLATAVPELGTWMTAEGDPGIGSVSAPVTIIEYGDYQCPNCRQFAAEVLPWLKQTWIREGFVRVIFRDFAILGPESKSAAVAAHCAGDQGRYWDYHTRLFELQSGANQGTFSSEALTALAEDAGLQIEPFSACLDANRYAAKVDSSTQSALDQGFEGTPTFVVNGRPVAGAIEAARWDELFRLYQREFASGGGGS